MATIFCNGTTFTDVRGVFLDKDGTLADVATYLARLGHIQAQLMEQQQPGTYDMTLQVLGFTADGLSASGLLAVGSRQETIAGVAAAAAMVGCPWIRAVELATVALSAADRQCSPKTSHTPLLPGVLGLLQRFRKAGLKIVMVSADIQSNLENFVDCYELSAYFDGLQGVSIEHPSKTEPSFLQQACHSLGILPAQGLVIGDAASDFCMAQGTM